MWSPNEITAGTARLVDNKMTGSDRETLEGVFKLYLKNRFSMGFSDIGARLAALEDSDDVKTAAKEAATLILLEENGFDLAELRGGRSGLQTENAGEMVLKIRLALTILGYELPEEFSGAVENGSENVFGIDAAPFFASSVVNKNIRW